MKEPNADSTNNLILHKKKILIAIGVIILLLVIFGVWLYTGTITGAKRQIFSTVPLPVAFVEWSPITGQQLYQRVELGEKLLNTSGSNDDIDDSSFLDQLIEVKKIETIARHKNIQVTSEEIDKNYQNVLAQFPQGSEAELEKELLSNYGLDLRTFKNEVIRQSVLQDNIAIWFHSQENLNPESYLQARELMGKLDGGASFDEMALTSSEDEASKNFAGDNGFISYEDLLPEFQKAVEGLSIGDTKLVTSRYGLHIMRLNGIEGDESTADEEKSYNIQQIFIAPEDFQAWFKAESTKINSLKLI